MTNTLFFVIAYQRGDFKFIGTLTGMSAVQGGPGLPLFLPVVYQYISTGTYSVGNVADKDVPDIHVQSLLSEVWLQIAY